MLQRLFKLEENNTNAKTEVVAGITTFMTLSYIIFVQPTVLSAFSITEGIAFGFISYALLKLITGRRGEVHGLVYLFAVLCVVRYIFLQ